MERVRYAVEVVAGLIPGRPEPEFTRQFPVTSSEWRLASEEGLEGLTAENSPWDEAQKYAATLVDPNRVNWVQVSWVWF